MVKGTNAKKAQILGQVFIFILAGLIFILIITYGYNAIQYFIETQEQVLLVDFRADLEIALEGVKRDYGSVRKAKFKLPSKYVGICFFDYISDACSAKIGTVDPKLKLPNQEIGVTWAEEACKLRSANIFTIPRGQDIDLPDIQVDGGYVCIPNLDGVTVRLEGTGRKAKVSEWKSR